MSLCHFRPPIAAPHAATPIETIQMDSYVSKPYFLLPLPLPASLSEAIVVPVGGREREDAEEDIAIDVEPTPLPPPPPVPLPPTSVAERRLASSCEPTDSIVGIRLITPPSMAIDTSVGTLRPNSSTVTVRVRACPEHDVRVACAALCCRFLKSLTP